MKTHQPKEVVLMKKKRINPEITTTIEPKEMAKYMGLVYVNDQKPGFHRKRKGKQFNYIGLDNKIIRDKKEIKRIQALAIPPAYTDVWICPNPNGHLQATGRDAKGRKQYRYHSRWKEVSDEKKYNKMIVFAKALPSIRQRINQDIALPGIPKEKVLAAVVHLLEVTLIRVGNEEYARENQSFGLTTLRNRHVNVEGTKISFKFHGKSGQYHAISIYDRRLSKIVKRCKDLPGQELFEYLNEAGETVSLSSTDVNEYLQTITSNHFTAKDFRTWAGTVLAVFALKEFQQFDTDVQAKKNIVKAIEKVAKRLGNTSAVCRKSYIHPEIFNAYLDKTLFKTIRLRTTQKSVDALTDLTPEEAEVLAFLQHKLKSELEKASNAT